MEKRFIALWNRIGAKGTPKEEFVKLVSMYSEPQRFYHNMNHVKNCLVELDSARSLISQPDLVELAIWYHDAIYDTRTKENEERSAQLAYDVCASAEFPETFSKGVKDLILATKHDVIPDEIDGKFLVDIDLSILGKPRQEFDEYEKNIRREYSWVPEDKYREGRSAILKMFLDRESIYLTYFFINKYEVQARENIAYSMKKLRDSSEDLEFTLMLPNRHKELPAGGLGLFDHWIEDGIGESHLGADIGIFSHYAESDKKEDLPDAGIGIFRHWVEDD